MIMLFARKLDAIRLFDDRRRPGFQANCRDALCTAAVENALSKCIRSALQTSRAAHAVLDGPEKLRIPVRSIPVQL
jgi:hypothetical protein